MIFRTLQAEEIWSVVQEMIQRRRQKTFKGDPMLGENSETSDIDSAAADISTKDKFLVNKKRVFAKLEKLFDYL